MGNRLLARLSTERISVRQAARLAEMPRRLLAAALDDEPVPQWAHYVVNGLLADIYAQPNFFIRDGGGGPEVLQGEEWAAMTARQALPILVAADQPMTYQELDRALAERHERTPSGTLSKFGYPLGRLGRAVIEVGERLDLKVPPICVMVINGTTGQPGGGVDMFLWDYLLKTDRKDLGNLLNNFHERAYIVSMLQQEVLDFDRWDDVVDECLDR